MMLRCRAVALTVILGAATFAPACGNDDGGEDGTSAGPDVGVLLSEISDHPEPMYGRTVTISGEVRERIAPRAVLLGRAGGGSDDAVLVVSERPAPSDLAPQSIVAVTGVVRPARKLRLASYGVDAGDEAVAPGGGVVVARRFRHPTAATAGDTESPKPSAFGERGITVGDVVANTDRYVGRRVTVSGEIESTLQGNAFLLGDAEILVVSAEPTEAFAEATGIVTGVVRRLGRPDLERRFGVRLPRSFFDHTGSRTTIVASNVHVVA